MCRTENLNSTACAKTSWYPHPHTPKSWWTRILFKKFFLGVQSYQLIVEVMSNNKHFILAWKKLILFIHVSFVNFFLRISKQSSQLYLFSELKSTVSVLLTIDYFLSWIVFEKHKSTNSIANTIPIEWRGYQTTIKEMKKVRCTSKVGPNWKTMLVKCLFSIDVPLMRAICSLVHFYSCCARWSTRRKKAERCFSIPETCMPWWFQTKMVPRTCIEKIIIHRFRWSTQDSV